MSLVKLEEDRVGEEMSQTKKALLFDGWTCGATHYLGLIASYCAKQPGGTEVWPRLSSIAVAPLGQTSDNGEGESARFEAEAHLYFFKQVFDFYKLNFND